MIILNKCFPLTLMAISKSVLLLALIVSVIACGPAFAQEVSFGSRNPPPRTTKIDVGDSPLHISRTSPWSKGGSVSTRVPLTEENRVGYTVFNSSDKRIRGYSLLLVNGTDTSVRMATYFGNPIEPNKDLPFGYILASTDEPSWAFDWILFDDGTTWGPDKYERSKELLGFLQGRERAIELVSDMAGYSDRIVRILRYGGHRHSSFQPQHKESAARSLDYYFSQGYQSVIDVLIKHPDLAKIELSSIIAQLLKEREPAVPVP